MADSASTFNGLPTIEQLDNKLNKLSNILNINYKLECSTLPKWLKRTFSGFAASDQEKLVQLINMVLKTYSDFSLAVDDLYCNQGTQ